jgi:hypothetical protein
LFLKKNKTKEIWKMDFLKKKEDEEKKGLTQ